MAVPKHRKSKSRKRMHRRINMKMSLPSMAKCPECGGLTPAHKVCIHCGYYKGNLVVEVQKA
jgi:large subunit ribosomal protein L32